MKPEFTELLAWSDYPRLKVDALCAKFPKLKQQVDASDDEADRHGDDRLLGSDDQRDFVVLSGDVSISDQQLAALDEEDSMALIVVDGNVQFESRARQFFYVSGDLYCRSINLDGNYVGTYVDGEVFAADCAELCAEDDGAMRDSPKLRLTTRFLFSWFYKIDQIELCPDAVIVILGDWRYCTSLEVANPVLVWHDCMHVLDDRFLPLVSCPGSDEHSWISDGIEEALLRNRSIYKPGYDIACYEWQQQAEEALRADENRTAYLRYRQATVISPSSYVAWFGMGEALRAEGAMAQALPVFIKAAALFPQDQRGLVNSALNRAALCAMHCRDLELAVELATASITHNGEADRGQNEYAPAYRFRAEALMLMGKHTDALADLECALKLDYCLEYVHWLKGLVLLKLGQGAESGKAHKEAERFARATLPSYEEQQSTDFLRGETVTVDWEQLGPETASLPVKDEAYWRGFMRNNVADRIKRVPAEYRSRAMLEELIARLGGDDSAAFAGHFPAPAFTHESAALLVARSARNLTYIPATLIDKALCMLAPAGGYGFEMAFVPPACVDRELCLHAVQCGANLKTIPEHFVDRELCLVAVRSDARAVKEVPPALIDDDMIAAAIAHGDYYFFDNGLPGFYKRPHLLEKAVRDYKRSLDAITGHRFDQTLFEVAKQCYGNDSDWPEIVARHDQQFCRNNRDESADQVCWAAFWDEAFMCKQIAKEDSYLSPWLIPDAMFTQAVADACFKRHPIHLDSIPKRFINQAMCDRFRKQYPDMLDHVPVAYRTAPICNAAVKEEAKNILLVPLALRTTALCVAALRDDTDLDSAVPANVYHEVYDLLIKKHKADFNAVWLHLRRGDGALWTGRPELAMPDYQLILDSAEELDADEDDLEEARYRIGYLHYLTGDLAQAAHWYAQTSDWPEYDDSFFVSPTEPVDFEQNAFDALMHDLDQLTSSHDYASAYTVALDAEKMLTDAASSDSYMWASVFDKKRFLSYELALWDVNEATCRAAIDKLELASTFEFASNNNAIRHTLRACYFRLASMDDYADLTLAELESRHTLMKQAFAIRGPGEDDDVFDAFRANRADLLKLLAAKDASYQAEFERVAKDLDAA